MNPNIYEAEYVQHLFDEMSESYERMNIITSFGFSVRWRKQLLANLDDSDKPLEIIDLMTGMGENWEVVRHRFPNCKLTALDFSKEMIKRASYKNQLKFGNNVELLQEDVLQSNLPSNKFDVVVCSFGLKTFNMMQIEKLAEEVHRILKVGGQFSFIEISIPHYQLLRTLYGFYLGKVIPILGKLLLGNPSEYRMLWQYTEKFKNAELAAQIFERKGLIINHQSYFYGCATGFTGEKRS